MQRYPTLATKPLDMHGGGQIFEAPAADIARSAVPAVLKAVVRDLDQRARGLVSKDSRANESRLGFVTNTQNSLKSFHSAALDRKLRVAKGVCTHCLRTRFPF